MKHFTIAALATLLLTGCTEMVPVVTRTLDNQGNIVSTVSSATSTASMEKERLFTEMVMNRDIQQAKMYAESGMSMTWKAYKEEITVVTDGAPPVTIIMSRMLPDVAMREQPRFQQPLPDGPSVHPVWATTAELGKIIAKYGLIGFGIDRAADVLETGFARAGDRFEGPAYLYQSKNTAGRDQDFSLAGGTGDGLAGDLTGVSAADFEACTAGGISLGSAAGCLAERGYDIKIEGGLAYVDGKEFDALNEWEASK